MYMHNEMADRNIVDDKIELLKDFCILRKGATKQEESVRIILSNCPNELAMERKLFNVLHGNESLKDLIKRELN